MIFYDFLFFLINNYIHLDLNRWIQKEGNNEQILYLVLKKFLLFQKQVVFLLDLKYNNPIQDIFLDFLFLRNEVILP